MRIRVLKMKILVLITLFSCVNPFVKSFVNENVSVQIKKYDPRSFFFLPPIIPLNSLKRRKSNSQKQPCVGDCGMNGICTSKSECGTLNGTPSGLCSDSAVCCIFYSRCGSTTSAETSYFVNPKYPEVYQGGSQCVLKVVKSNPKICQIRIDFKEFTLSQPSNDGKCQNDFFSANNCLINKICGENKGQHVYMDFPEGSDSLTLSVDTNAAEKGNRKWNLEIKQISCDSSLLATMVKRVGRKFKTCLKRMVETFFNYKNEAYTAPSGCLMYFTGTSGSVSSFNYGESKQGDIKKNRQIRGLNYGICVHSKNEYCSIEWSKDADPYSFTISGNSSLIAAGSTNGSVALLGDECRNSFIIIANPYQNETRLDMERFCGSSLSPTTTSMKPFVLYVVMGQNFSDGIQDEGNRGFKLNFRQLPCRN